VAHRGDRRTYVDPLDERTAEEHAATPLVWVGITI
jgi:hypothetical protein